MDEPGWRTHTGIPGGTGNEWRWVVGDGRPQGGSRSTQALSERAPCLPHAAAGDCAHFSPPFPGEQETGTSGGSLQSREHGRSVPPPLEAWASAGQDVWTQVWAPASCLLVRGHGKSFSPFPVLKLDIVFKLSLRLAVSHPAGSCVFTSIGPQVYTVSLLCENSQSEDLWLTAREGLFT